MGAATTSEAKLVQRVRNEEKERAFVLIRSCINILVLGPLNL